MTDSLIYAICGDIINISNTLVLESQTIEISGNIDFKEINNDVSINGNIIFDTSLNSNKDVYNYLLENYTGNKGGEGNALRFHPTENILLVGRSNAPNGVTGIIETIDLRTNINNLNSYTIYTTSNWALGGNTHLGAYNSCFITNTVPPTIYTVQQNAFAFSQLGGYHGDFGFTYNGDWYTFGESLNHGYTNNQDTTVNDSFYYRTDPNVEANCPEVEFHGDDSGNIFIVHSRYNDNDNAWALYANSSLQIYEISNNNGFNDIRQSQTRYNNHYHNNSYEFTDYWQTSDIGLDTTSNKCCSHISADGNYVAYGININNNYIGKIVILKRMQWKQWNNIQTITGKAVNEFFGSHLVFNYDASILVTSNNPYHYDKSVGYYDITQSNSNTIFTRIYQRDNNNNYIQMGNDIDGYNAQIARANNIVANISSDNLYVNFYKYVNNDWQKYGYSIKHGLPLNISTYNPAGDTVISTSNKSKPIISLNFDCTLVAISNSVYRANNRERYTGEIELYGRKDEYMNFKKIITGVGEDTIRNYSNSSNPSAQNPVTARYMNLNLHNFV